MTVFKTVLNIVNKYKGTILLYTMLLVFFTAINLQTSDSSVNYVAKKPDVLIINNDEDKGITKHLINYFEENANIVDVENNEDAINDALFYRDVNYIVYVPENFRNDFLNGLNPEIEIKTTDDYAASLANILLSKYIKLANIYRNNNSEEEIMQKIDMSLKNNAEVVVKSKLDTNTLYKVTFYFSFLNYGILAGCVYVLCLILSSFKETKIYKRTIISSTNYKKFNRQLLLSTSLVAIFLWLFYIILSFIMLGEVMLTSHGIIYIINSFIFFICALAMAFLIGNLVNNKNAINGIINVVALGSSFLCGCFVPMEYLPDSVVKVAHILPSYWYIKTNEEIKTLEIINFDTLKPLFGNMLMLIVFILVFIIITNIISKKKQKIA